MPACSFLPFQRVGSDGVADVLALFFERAQHCIDIPGLCQGRDREVIVVRLGGDAAGDDAEVGAVHLTAAVLEAHLEQVGQHVAGLVVAGEGEIAQRVHDVLAVIFLDGVDAVAVMAHYQISPVIDGRLGKLLLPAVPVL